MKRLVSSHDRFVLSLLLAEGVLISAPGSAFADLGNLHDTVHDRLPEFAGEVHSAVAERVESRSSGASALDGVLSSVERTVSSFESTVSQYSSASSAGQADSGSAPDAGLASGEAGTEPGSETLPAEAETPASELPQSRISDLAIAVHDALADNHYKHETNVDVLSGRLHEFDFLADNSEGIAISRGGASSSSSTSSSGGDGSPQAEALPDEDSSAPAGDSADDHSINDTISVSLQDQDGNVRVVNLSLNVDHVLSGNTLDKVENITVLSNNTHSVRILSGNSRSIAVARGSLLGGGSASAAASSASGSGASSAAAAAASGGVTVIRTFKEPAPAQKGPVTLSTAGVTETVVQSEPVYTGDPAESDHWVVMMLAGLAGTTGCTRLLRKKKSA